MGAGWKKQIGQAFVLACLGGIAWLNRFVQDDAFISFRYARNLAEGHGLVWNIGERVEGYTNFLWTVCLAPAFRLGVDVVLYSFALSLAAYICTLWCAWRLAEDIWQERRAGLLAVLLLGTNFSFSSYGTGGLETQFVTALIMAAICLISLWQKDERAGWLIGASAVSACAVMTRMDAALLLGAFWVWVLVQSSWRRRWRQILAAGLIGLAPLAAWLVWRHAYYGALVPNTSLVKMGGGGPTWMRGAVYLGMFYAIYGYVLAVPVCLAGIWRALRWPLAICVAAAVIVWHGYVVWVGGDFMEFRMLVPSLPLAVALIAGAVGRLGVIPRAAVVSVLIACSEALCVTNWDYPCTEPKHQLQKNVVKWRTVADVLNRTLGEDRKAVKIGVTCAGVIPFYTGMPTLDLLGLNDRNVALEGNRIIALVPLLGNRPGHVRMASQKQVREKGVHLLLNDPWVVSDEEMRHLSAEQVRRRWSVPADGDERRITWEMVEWPEDSGFLSVVAWPCGGENHLLSLYVRQNERIDAAIKRSGATVLQ